MAILSTVVSRAVVAPPATTAKTATVAAKAATAAAKAAAVPAKAATVTTATAVAAPSLGKCRSRREAQEGDCRQARQRHKPGTTKPDATLFFVPKQFHSCDSSFKSSLIEFFLVNGF